jgi:hypothetical protein
MITATNFGKGQYALLGKLLFQTHPELAHELISVYLPPDKPSESEFERIQPLFGLFCDLQNLQPSDYIGAIHKSSKVDIRRVFVAVILHLFCPEVFNHPADYVVPKYGLVKNLQKVLGFQSRGNISTLIREAIMWEKRYDDFAFTVNKLTQQIIEHGSPEGK